MGKTGRSCDKRGMTDHQESKVAILGNYPPRQCGIATFTSDLRMALNGAETGWPCPVVSVTDPGNTYPYPPEVRFEIPEADAPSYLRAADFLNLSRADVLCLQHEFGIFGGPAGSHILSLLRRARMPTVTTLHTVLESPAPDQKRALDELAECSTRLVVMTQKGADLLREVHGVPEEKISVIHHGIPDIPFVDPNFYKDHFGVAGRPVLLTFGLLSPGKGIEYAIRALPRIVEEHPDVIYIVLGATHPNLLRQDGETYRHSLQILARELGVENQVMFVNRYVETAELCEFIGAADVYLTPYLNESQITSGTLAYCFGAGKAVVSTPYWHAAELLKDGRGELVPFRDADAIADAVLGIFSNETRRHAMRKQAYLMGRDMVWKEVAKTYRRVFEEARGEFQSGERRISPRRRGSTQPPPWRFDHLLRMSDSTGVFQHAIHTVPWFEHGYCTDDNARALLLTVLLEESGEDTKKIRHLQTTTAAFLQHAFSAENGRFRNFMSFERQWMEEAGSEDSHGRALWALGAVVGRTRRPGLRALAASLMERALPALPAFTSPRAWAFALLGLQEYFRSFHGDLLANRLREELAGKLFALFESKASAGWEWCEDIVAYDNARLAQALILAGRYTGNDDMKTTGLRALRWLMHAQTADSGCFRPIGSNGFWRRGDEPARFDQQPLEAAASAAACIEAFHATGDPDWKTSALQAFDWFLGANDLGLSLYDTTSGGCFDGLHDNRVNGNQGAESTLSFLITLAEMRALATAQTNLEKIPITLQ
jgi:glycosyltransferase involved in cell wall biosynthesis